MVFPVFHGAFAQNEDADVVYSTSVNNPDVFADAGSPVAPKLFKILILPGVVLGSTTVSAAGLDLVGFPGGSTFLIEGRGIGNQRGRVQGMGGNGGGGGSVARQSFGGGGGGGAGTVAGLGVVGGSGAPTAGEDGTGTAGGAGGQGELSSIPLGGSAGAGQPGGTAMATRGFTVELFNLAVWGGGGGGSGGVTADQAGDGGDPGEDGESVGANPGGTRGIAIVHQANPPTQSGATDVRGTVQA